MLQAKIEIRNEIKSLEDLQRADKAILNHNHDDYYRKYAEWSNKLWETRQLRWYQVKSTDPDYMPELGTLQNICRGRSFDLFVMNCAWYVVKHRLSGEELEAYKEKVRLGISPWKANRSYRDEVYFIRFWQEVEKYIDKWTDKILRELDERKKSE